MILSVRIRGALIPIVDNELQAVLELRNTMVI